MRAAWLREGTRKPNARSLHPTSLVELHAANQSGPSDSLVILVCWLLWKERNNRTFDRRLQTIQDVLARIANEIVVWYQASFRHLEVDAGALG